ncbi:CaiB/BaiF CoA transferase family protein [Nocardia australiensis]|uniref:CaiB/BaiF CoA transferase family protein n=1 Tax=Nocardia australiensis TaxID=2887191 RepID=UPI001D153F3B|nr:CaiB/BaiF CoA-transferase family protein [Nocardia australiensis]
MGGPLHSSLVLSLASVGPAARAARLLADYGAEVIEIGPPPGHDRTVPVFHAYAAHRGMRRMCVDLGHRDGAGVVSTLGRRADVLLESFRPGVADRLGVGYASLCQQNPRLVYCSTTGYGQADERSSWAGHDLNYVAASGFLACTEPNRAGGPPLPGATVADSAGGGMHAVMAVLAALVARGETGTGTYLDVSIVGGTLAMMGLAVDEYLATGTEPGPGHGILTGAYACYGCYQASDGKWLSVAAIERGFWANLCREVGLDQWIDRQTDSAVQQRIRADLSAVFATRSRDEWVTRLAPADTCVAPVLTAAEAAEDAASHGLVGTARHPTRGEIRQLAPTLAGSGSPPAALPDWETTHTDQILAEAEYGRTQIAELRSRKVVA